MESEAAVFSVGVGHKPIFSEKDGSPMFWALEAHTGNPFTSLIRTPSTHVLIREVLLYSHQCLQSVGGYGSQLISIHVSL